MEEHKPGDWADDEARARADQHYNDLKNSGELRRLEDERALAIQIKEGGIA